MPVSVIKKDGGRELFDKQKLFTGISRACEKTNFSSEAITVSYTHLTLPTKRIV